MFSCTPPLGLPLRGSFGGANGGKRGIIPSANGAGNAPDAIRRAAAQKMLVCAFYVRKEAISGWPEPGRPDRMDAQTRGQRHGYAQEKIFLQRGRQGGPGGAASPRRPRAWHDPVGGGSREGDVATARTEVCAMNNAECRMLNAECTMSGQRTGAGPRALMGQPGLLGQMGRWAAVAAVAAGAWLGCARERRFR